MGHDHAHPVIVASLVAIMLYLVLTRPVEEKLLRMLLTLVFLTVLLLLYQRWLGLP